MPPFVSDLAGMGGVVRHIQISEVGIGRNTLLTISSYMCLNTDPRGWNVEYCKAMKSTLWLPVLVVVQECLKQDLSCMLKHAPVCSEDTFCKSFDKKVNMECLQYLQYKG